MKNLSSSNKKENICIRFADQTDLEQLVDYESGIDRDELVCRIWAGQIYILEADGRFAGWLRYSFFADSIPCLNILYIFSPFRNRGCGSRLLHCWEQHLKENHYRTVLALVADEPGRTFCMHNGYRPSGKLDQEIVLYSEITSKQLQQPQISA